MKFQQLGNLASERLGETRRLLMATILRFSDSPHVPSDYLDETLGGKCFFASVERFTDQTVYRDHHQNHAPDSLYCRTVSLG